MAFEQNPDMELRLIQRAQQGDRSAFGELVCLHYDNVIRLVYRMCGEVQIAEDATQEAFIRVWTKLSSYQPRSPFRNWLYRIATNAALDILRRKPEECLDDEDMSMLADQSSSPEVTLIEKEKNALLQDMVKSLPEAARSVLVLREYGELSYQEIAEVLDIPIGTVMSRLNYARNRLREIFHSRQLEVSYYEDAFIRSE